ncbi:minor capsid protein [Capybara microvirus Cap1_SP_99]|nr:minor capsid protein [Capybara microvirus Cap1_SP_99]
MGFDVTSLFSPVSSIFGGILGSIGQSQTNRTNLQIARETNDLQYRMFKEQNDWNMNMWNMTNEYNTVANQRERVKEAGLNPLGYNYDGMAANTMSSAQPLAPQMPSLQNPLQGLSQGLIAAGNQFASAQLAAAQTKKIEAEIPLTQEQTKAQQLLNKFTEDTQKARTVSENAAAYRSLWENRTYADAWKKIAIDPQSTDALRDSLYSTFEIPVQQVCNLMKENKKISSDIAKNYADIENMANMIAYYNASLENGMSIAQITAAMTKYTADRGYEAAQLTADKTGFGFLIDILNEAGVKKDLVVSLKKFVEKYGFSSDDDGSGKSGSDGPRHNMGLAIWRWMSQTKFGDAIHKGTVDNPLK